MKEKYLHVYFRFIIKMRFFDFSCPWRWLSFVFRFLPTWPQRLLQFHHKRNFRTLFPMVRLNRYGRPLSLTFLRSSFSLSVGSTVESEISISSTFLSLSDSIVQQEWPEVITHSVVGVFLSLSTLDYRWSTIESEFHSFKSFLFSFRLDCR
jgi:hypothetical protein